MIYNNSNSNDFIIGENIGIIEYVNINGSHNISDNYIFVSVRDYSNNNPKILLWNILIN
jgi:hypothetical protein